MLVHPEIDPVAIQIGPLAVHWYGLMYLFGFATAWLLAMHRAGKPSCLVQRKQVENLVTYGAFGVIIGARVGYVLFYNFSYWMSDPLYMFRVWEGGMSFHGGLLGVTLAMLIYAQRARISFVRLMDFVAPFIPPGLGFGRLGNFISQELWGRPTDVSWGMVFPRDPEGLARHPSQLYQAVLEGLVLFVVLYWFSRKPRPTGAVCGMFLLLYGLFRSFVEFFREPDAHIQFDFFGWVTRGQLLSLPMILLGAGLITWGYWRERNRVPGAQS